MHNRIPLPMYRVTQSPDRQPARRRPRRRVFLILLGPLMVFCVLSPPCPADERQGSIRGRVCERVGEPLPGAHVSVQGTRLGATTDADGHYVLPKLPPGIYSIEVSFIGYAPVTCQVLVRSGEVSTRHVVLDQTAFQIGTIECLGTTELLPTNAQSRTTITGAEVEHYQASSIRDVLDLVPGVQKTDNPGLGKSSSIAVRGDIVDPLSSFGTLVLVDGVPQSNNANLQFERYTASKTGPSNLGSGADLRLIPADNVQGIEVITGVPSVRYGDVTSGVVNVQTRMGPQPHRLKIKSNPDTREGNFSGGTAFDGYDVSYNFNAAYSERDIRKVGDEYTRLTGQAVLRTRLFDDALFINNKFLAQQILDEEEPKDDLLMVHNYNRGYSLGYTLWGTFTPELQVSTYEYNAFLTYRKENSMRSRLVQSDLRILPSGDTVSSYAGRVETHGAEWTLGGRFEWNRVFFTGDFLHRLLVGADVQYNDNTGEGVLIDTLFNYYGSQSGKTSYSFDEVPGQTLLSVYAEDKFTGNLGIDVVLTLGFRYEMYRPYAVNLAGIWGDGDIVRSHQGTFFNPRANLMLFLSSVSQVRMSAGFSSKSPPMSSIYPEPDVIRWRDPSSGALIYYRPDRMAPNLLGYREGQVELSYDHRLFDRIGGTLTGFYKERTGEPEAFYTPVFFTPASGYPVYYADEYSVYGNTGWTKTWGAECALRTSQIHPLNMEFQLTGSYLSTKTGRNSTTFDPTPDASYGQKPNYPVPGTDTTIGMIYPSGGSWKDRLILNYFLKYAHPRLGLWVTFRAEQLLFERTQSYGLAPVDPSVMTPSLQLERAYDEAIHPRYVKWLFNINISKSLWKGAEVSLYVNNLLDEAAIGRYPTSSTQYSDVIRNPPLFYGIEFSMVVDEFFR